MNIFKHKIFIKIFSLIFLSLFVTLSFLFYRSINQQEQTVVSSYTLKAKSIGDLMKFASSEAMIVDDETKILELIYDFVQSHKYVATIEISRKNSDTIIINKNKWELKEAFNFVRDEVKAGFKIEKSNYIKKEVFKYRYPIYFSNILWGWFDIHLYLDEYNKKLEATYMQLFYITLLFLVISILISLFIARLIAKPIISLKDVANEIANGDLNRRAIISNQDEIGQLASSFNQMVVSLQNSQEKLKKSHDDLELRVNERTRELKILNETLEERIKVGISKQKEQEEMLIQQSKLAAMGEMIGNIAHQWRQPLNALGLVVQNMKFAYEMDELDDEFMDRSIKKVNLLTNNMSKTIDDFRNFFKPNKEKTYFSLDNVINNAISLVESAFTNSNIKINYEKGKKEEVFGFPNEFSQTILNILSNAKDALLEKRIENAQVNIDIKDDEDFAYVCISDNAGGIPEDIIEKIFNPYFSTKEEGKGTGVGLYMSKIIIEKNMNGKLSVENIQEGAKFTVKIPKYGEK